MSLPEMKPKNVGGGHSYSFTATLEEPPEGPALRMKLSPATPAFRTGVTVRVSAAPLHIQLPAIMPGKQPMMVQILEFLLSMRETRMGFLAPGFNLTQYWP